MSLFRSLRSSSLVGKLGRAAISSLELVARTRFQLFGVDEARGLHNPHLLGPASWHVGEPGGAITESDTLLFHPPHSLEAAETRISIFTSFFRHSSQVPSTAETTSKI